MHNYLGGPACPLVCLQWATELNQTDQRVCLAQAVERLGRIADADKAARNSWVTPISIIRIADHTSEGTVTCGGKQASCLTAR